MNLYRHFDKDKTLLYVGVSLSAITRTAEHRDQSAWYNEIATITIQRFPTKREALDAERAAIQSENPVHNVRYSPKRPASRLERALASVNSNQWTMRSAKYLVEPLALHLAETKQSRTQFIYHCIRTYLPGIMENYSRQ